MSNVTATDFLGRELCVGDEVVFMMVSYRELIRANVTKVTAHKVALEWRRGDSDRATRTTQLHSQVVRIPEGY